MKDIWTVSELNEGIKTLLDEHFGLLWVEGEVSNLRRPSSGHIYFTLKDEKSQIRSVIFHSPYARKAFAQALPAGFDLEDGMHITCRARLTVYSPRGEYQLIIDRVEPRGLGALQKAYEQLKARLEAEGLFNVSHKKKIPYLPERIGVVTSPTGAVIRDILHITGRRFASVRIVIAPVRVQGPEAAGEIIRAIADLNRLGNLDVIILARGGGSFEDLYPFNTEGVARAVFASGIPVISAVGHETDTTISDFVADLRAPTPSAAAELVAPLREDLLNGLASLYRRLLTLQRQGLTRRNIQLTQLKKHLKDPRRLLEDQHLNLDHLLGRMQSLVSFGLTHRRRLQEQLAARLQQVNPLVDIRRNRLIIEHERKNMTALIKNVMDREREKLLSRQAALNSLNPLAVLARGYSLTLKVPEGWIVKDAGALKRGDDVRVRLARGSFDARVTGMEEQEE